MMILKNVGGYLTVYMTMVLSVILSLCMTMIEGARRSAMRMEAEVITDTAMRSVLAEYNRELMRQYNIFAVDSSYGSTISGIGRTSDRFKEYMEKNYTWDTAFPLFSYRDFIGARPEEASVTGALYLTDDAGKIFRECAIDAIRDDFGIEAVEQVIGWSTSADLTAADSMDVYSEMNSEAGEVSGAADAERTRREAERASQEAEYEKACLESADAGEEEPAKPELTELPEEYRSPVSSVSDTSFTGILGLLVDDPENLSRRQLDQSGIISGRMSSGNINTGTLSRPGPEAGITDEVLNKALFDEYLMKYMGSYGNTDPEDAMWYQIEYLIAGKQTDVENLNSVAMRIMSIRAGMNMIYLESDSVKKAEAGAIAAAICTACMIEWMTPVLTHTILLAWALVEARYDTATLLSGGKIPFMKDSSTWHSDLDSALSGGAPGADKDSDSGLSYGDYLRIFLLMTDTDELTLRAMDIVESDIRLSPGNGNFRMDSCIEMIECSASIKSNFGSRITIKRTLKY